MSRPASRIAGLASAVAATTDPLAALAETHNRLRNRLQIAPPVPEELRLAWRQAARAAVSPEPPPRPLPKQYAPSQYAVLIPCRDEPHQLELLTRFHAEGIECWVLLS